MVNNALSCGPGSCIVYANGHSCAGIEISLFNACSYIGDKNGEQPIHEAASVDCLVTLQFLLKKGAKINAADSKGQTPLHKVSKIWMFSKR